MDITFHQLEIFRAIVVAGSISKAAKVFGLSQPTMSQHLANFEEILGVQLLQRHGSGVVALTPDGDFWFRSSEELIGRLAWIKGEHERRFTQARAVLRLGTTPALRGRFTAAAGRIALEGPDFTNFELTYEATSEVLAQKLRMHRINMAILAERAIGSETSSFAIAKLFDDAIAWVVPASVSDEEIRYALNGSADPKSVHPSLRRHIEVRGVVTTRTATEDWYRSRLPHSVPVLSAPTFATCVEFVAEGLATGHMLLSLWPNLSEPVRSKLKVFELPGVGRPVVLAMHKHLQSHSGFSRIFGQIMTFCQTEYKSEMHAANLRPFTELSA